MKIIVDRHADPNSHLMNLGNTLDVEARFFERLSQLKSTSLARVPHYAGYARQERGKPGIIIMEQLNATDLQHIFLSREPLPTAFDPGIFVEELEEFLNDMHAKAQIAHGDLEPRNIMVDRVTGLPYVIDFGRSIELSRLSPEKRRRVEDADWEKLETLSEQVHNLTIKSKDAII